MTEPTDPNDPDWGFPEVDPASTELPPDDDVLEALDALSSRATGEGPFDTGSDAWWRAQAAAQREAASQEPAVPPAPAPAPQRVGNGPASPPASGQDPTPKPPPGGAASPLDAQWLPEVLRDAPSGPPR
ncbi:MAG: hypothetical protein M3P04_12995, partial [Actinomycetota bacterium]|nr:hypothetical protein [Actinomycetota bacterium]